MKWLHALDEGLMRVLRWFVTTLCVGIALILLVRVVVRFTPLTLPLSWTDEVVEWMMAWMIFTAATVILRNGDHFRIDLLQTRLGDRPATHIVNLGITALSFLFFLSLLYYSILLVIGATQFSPILKVSTRVPYLSIPVNCALMLCYLVRDFAREALALKAGRARQPADAPRQPAG